MDQGDLPRNSGARRRKAPSTNIAGTASSHKRRLAGCRQQIWPRYEHVGPRGGRRVRSAIGPAASRQSRRPRLPAKSRRQRAAQPDGNRRHPQENGTTREKTNKMSKPAASTAEVPRQMNQIGERHRFTTGRNSVAFRGSLKSVGTKLTERHRLFEMTPIDKRSARKPHGEVEAMPVDAALSRDGMSFIGEMLPDPPEWPPLLCRRVRRGRSLA